MSYSSVAFGESTYGAGVLGNPAFSTLSVQLALAANPLDALSSVTWTDITQYVEQIDITTGKTHELNRVEAGRLSLLLNNNDSRFSPFNTQSPYYNGGNGMIPARLVRVTATWGSLTKDKFTGIIESWPQTWHDAAKATVQLTATDAFKLYNRKNLTGVGYAAAVNAYSPSGYWRLGDAVGAASAKDSSVHGRTATPNGLVTFGTIGLMAADSDTAVTFDGNSYLDAGTGPQITALPFSVGFVMQTTDTAAPTGNKSMMGQGTGSHWAVSFNAQSSPLSVFVAGYGVSMTVNGYGVNTGTVGSSLATNDGKPHIVWFTASSSAMHCYVDGALADFAHSDGTVPVGSVPAAGTMTIGGEVGSSPGRNFIGVLDEVAILPGVELSAAQVATLSTLALKPGDGETSGARINRILDLIGVASADRNIDTGSSKLGPITAPPGNALGYMQQVSDDTERGTLFMDGSGKVAFYGRSHEIFNTNSTAVQLTLGDQAGQEPYLLDGTQITFDDLDIINDAQITRAGGALQVSTNSASQTKYGVRSKALSGLLQSSDNEAKALADYLVSRYPEAITRVTAAAVYPLSDPTILFPQVLNRGLLDRVKFVHSRYQDAFSQESLIEGVDHHITQQQWRATYHLSPVDPDATNYTVWDNGPKWGSGKWYF